VKESAGLVKENQALMIGPRNIEGGVRKRRRKRGSQESY